MSFNILHTNGKSVGSIYRTINCINKIFKQKSSLSLSLDHTKLRDYCKSCHTEKKKETSFHLHRHCLTLPMKRFTHLSQSFTFFEDLSDLKPIGVKTISLFLNSFKSFMEYWLGVSHTFFGNTTDTLV